MWWEYYIYDIINYAEIETVSMDKKRESGRKEWGKQRFFFYIKSPNYTNRGIQAVERCWYEKTSDILSPYLLFGEIITYISILHIVIYFIVQVSGCSPYFLLSACLSLSWEYFSGCYVIFFYQLPSQSQKYNWINQGSKVNIVENYRPI